MNFIDRLKRIWTEPSTWSSIAVAVAWFGSKLTPEISAEIQEFGVWVFLVINILWKRDSQAN